MDMEEPTVDKSKSKVVKLNSDQPALFRAGIDLKTFKSIRIAVSGDVQLNKLETAIIDTAHFQRLRGIKELGTSYFVYPTALHTRFDHSLGTLDMSMKMVRSIRENKHNSDEEKRIDEEQEQLIRLLALLHDITHIPFGHTLEDELSILPRHDKDHKRIEFYLGEDRPIGRIIKQYLGYDMYKRFMGLYKANKDSLETLGDDFFIYDLVNNTVCADLLDYLRRDCYFCNINLDTEYRFLRYLYLCKDGPTRKLVIRLWKEGKPTPRRDILSELTRLLDNRYLLGERVYFHHAKLVTGSMLGGAVQRAMDAKELKDEDLYEMTDDVLLYKLNISKIPTVKKLATCLNYRALWKLIFEKDRRTINAEWNQLRDIDLMETILDNWWKDAKKRTQEEDRVSALLGMDSGDILVHCPDSKMAMKLAEMKVIWNGKLVPLNQCKDDPIVGPKLAGILESHENLWGIRAFYNPDFQHKKDIIENACKYLFTFKTRDKTSHEKTFYKDIVEDIAINEGLGHTIYGNEYAQKVKLAVERLGSQTAALRNKEKVVQIVKDAFIK